MRSLESSVLQLQRSLVLDCHELSDFRQVVSPKVGAHIAAVALKLEIMQSILQKDAQP